MELKNGMIINCDTKEKADKLLKECHNQGWKWVCGDEIVDEKGGIIISNNWLFARNTVYYLREEGISFGYKWYAPEDKVISFDDLLGVEDKKCKIYQMPYFVHEDVEKVIVNEPCVIVFLRSGEKGIAKCCPDDKFEEIHGYSIAYQRATIQRIRNEMKYVEGVLNYLTK